MRGRLSFTLAGKSCSSRDSGVRWWMVMVLGLLACELVSKIRVRSRTVSGTFVGVFIFEGSVSEFV